MQPSPTFTLPTAFKAGEPDSCTIESLQQIFNAMKTFFEYRIERLKRAQATTRFYTIEQSNVDLENIALICSKLEVPGAVVEGFHEDLIAAYQCMKTLSRLDTLTQQALPLPGHETQQRLSAELEKSLSDCLDALGIQAPEGKISHWHQKQHAQGIDYSALILFNLSCNHPRFASKVSEETRQMIQAFLDNRLTQPHHQVDAKLSVTPATAALYKEGASYGKATNYPPSFSPAFKHYREQKAQGLNAVIEEIPLRPAKPPRSAKNIKAN